MQSGFTEMLHPDMKIPFGSRKGKSSRRSASTASGSETSDFVTVAILAKDAGHVLPLHLDCISKLRYPKDRLYLYVRTNNNNDATATVLRQWLDKVGDAYAGVHFDDSDVTVPVEGYDPHEWNPERVKVLGAIRQASIQWAYERNSHYFVSDCDNFFSPDALVASTATGLPIVAPLLTSSGAYANYHEAVNEWGYLDQTPLYLSLLGQEVRGLIEVPVVHCTYFVRHEVIPGLSFDDDSNRHEYVIFSDSARKLGVQQYLDNRKIYGHISFATDTAALEAEPWYIDFTSQQASEESTDNIDFASAPTKAIRSRPGPSR